MKGFTTAIASAVLLLLIFSTAVGADYYLTLETDVGTLPTVTTVVDIPDINDQLDV